MAETIEIPLTQGQVTIIDAECFDLVRGFTWHASLGTNKKFYAKTRNSMPMTKLLMDTPRGLVVDHINGDTLDNRRANLRICSRRENAWNTRATSNAPTVYKGVSKARGRWAATIHIHLGYFDTPEQAAEAYDSAARELRKTHSRFNFPRSGEDSALQEKTSARACQQNTDVSVPDMSNISHAPQKHGENRHVVSPVSPKTSALERKAYVHR